MCDYVCGCGHECAVNYVCHAQDCATPLDQSNHKAVFAIDHTWQTEIMDEPPSDPQKMKEFLPEQRNSCLRLPGLVGNKQQNLPVQIKTDHKSIPFLEYLQKSFHLGVG